MLNKIKNLENKQDSFWKINFKKLVLFLALLAFVPVPVSFALAGGISTVLSSIPGMLYMIVMPLKFPFSLLIFSWSLLFFGQIFGYLFGGYALACLIYKLPSLIKSDIKGKVKEAGL